VFPTRSGRGERRSACAPRSAAAGRRHVGDVGAGPTRRTSPRVSVRSPVLQFASCRNMYSLEAVTPITTGDYQPRRTFNSFDPALLMRCNRAKRRRSRSRCKTIHSSKERSSLAAGRCRTLFSLKSPRPNSSRLARFLRVRYVRWRFAQSLGGKAHKRGVSKPAEIVGEDVPSRSTLCSYVRCSPAFSTGFTRVGAKGRVDRPTGVRSDKAVREGGG
jgi:hypothetical protein